MYGPVSKRSDSGGLGLWGKSGRQRGAIVALSFK